MQILIKEDEDIAKAHERYKTFTEDDRMKELYEARIKRQLDYNTDIELARQEGIEQGIEQEKKMVAVKLKQNKVNIRVIAQTTGLSEKEIKAL